MCSSAPEFAVVAITERSLCPEPLTQRVPRLIAAGFDAVILREKDLDPAGYGELARQVAGVLVAARHSPCRLILHRSARAGHGLHLPFEQARSWERNAFENLPFVGVSVHSVGEVLEAQRMGASYLVAGHVFSTSCKPGLAPRGVDVLARACAATPLPVLAVGGITPATIDDVRSAGARGVCVRSAAMTARPDELAALVEALRTGVGDIGF